MSNPYPSPSNRPLEQLKVAELRDELRRRGLSLKGVKKELFERLDEALREEQAGVLSNVPEVLEDQHKEVHGVYELEGEHEITYSAGQSHYCSASENVHDGDGLLYLNDSENPLQDSALIVNNASPYVGASDATPVFMEPCKDGEKLNSGMGTSEESKDDVLLTNNLNSSSTASMPESINAEAEDVSRPENLALEKNAVAPGVDDQALENVTSEPDKESCGNEAILPGKEANDVDMPAGSHQAIGNAVGLPESVSQAGGNCGLLAAPEVMNMNSTLSMDDSLPTRNCATNMDNAIAGETVTVVHDNCAPNMDDAVAGQTVIVVHKPVVADIISQGEMAIPSEAVEDAGDESVPDDLLSVTDASVPASSCVMIANDSTMQGADVIENTILTSGAFVPSVHELMEDGGLKVEVESTEGISLKFESAEDTKQAVVLESEEALIPTSADREVAEMPLDVPILEAVQDPVSPELQRDIRFPKTLQDSVMHEVVPDVLVQEVQQDIEMPEALESPSMKTEVSEMALDTKLPPVNMKQALDAKPENLGSLLAADSKEPNEAVRGAMMDEAKPNVKLEPIESESRRWRRTLPVENVRVEQQDFKEDLPRSGRSFDRSRSKESEHERSRHELGRSSAYGNERSRAEGRPGRVFREERRQDVKERELKPVEEEFTDHSGRKRKDDGRDTKQQEPAKRMRRWNSGNQLVVETAKPLTTGSVKDIMSPETKKEGFAVAPPKLTPKSSGSSRPIPATVKSNSEANGDKRAAPLLTQAPTSSLKIERFVRPFTLKAVKDLLSEFGQCVDFWMDQIKTHCYVMYSKVDEAVSARNGLYNKQWPPSFGNLLVADFVDPSEVKMRSDGTFERMNALAATTPRGLPSAQGGQPVGQHGHSNALAFAPPLRERQLMQVPTKEPEPPVPTLDDLFRKTKAKPHIYYLPLTDEQVAEKLVSVKNKEQAKSKSLSRL